MDVLQTLSTHKIIPVLTFDDAQQADPLAAALVSGGLPVAEVTFRTAAAAEAIAVLAARGDILVGAGTVLTPDQVDKAVQAGARYIVSPGTSRAVVERAREHGVTVLPGTVTATEIQAVLELGIRTVKFFPAGTSGGPAAIRALAAPFQGVTFIPTGGVSLANLSVYLSIPAVVAVGGTWMVPAKALQTGDFDSIRSLTAAAVAVSRPQGS
jgi:2-dehydro-3-deoxyphosphogluconate aldolase/(4S)-4-hydroxy-2-oxoglutarate aldolase